LAEQTTAIGIVENELNKSKSKLRVLEEDKNNKIRLIEINNYFGEKYAEHSNLMKIIICVLIPILILAILNKKGFISNTIYYILVVIIAIIGSIFFWRRMFSIFYRDPMNYQEYDWAFNPSKAPSNNGTSSSTDPWSIKGDFSGGTCIGDDCCSPGLIWDASLNQCIISNNAFPVTTNPVNKESFINNILTKHAYSFKKPDVVLNSEMINPSIGKSFINFGKY
jgi:hypothetical protein